MADLSLIPEKAWREAQRRADVIPTACRARPRATSLGLTERQIYTLLHRCREADGA